MEKIDKYIELCVEWFSKNQLPKENERTKQWYTELFKKLKNDWYQKCGNDLESDLNKIKEEVEKIEGCTFHNGDEYSNYRSYVKIKERDFEKDDKVKTIICNYDFYVVDEYDANEGGFDDDDNSYIIIMARDER